MQTDRLTSRQTDKQTGRKTYRPTDRQIGRLAYRQAGRQADWKNGRQTGRQIYRFSVILPWRLLAVVEVRVAVVLRVELVPRLTSTFQNPFSFLIFN
jgi:hypothetical protein